MRYFFLAWFLLVILGVSILGFRGSISRKPPLEVFPDMDRQAKLLPQDPSRFFDNERTSQLPVPGTIARTSPYELAPYDPNLLVYSYENVPGTTGVIQGTTNFVETIPFQVTASLLARGQERYAIYCTPCHGAVGDGKGITTQFGMTIIRNLHEPRLVQMPDGELFSVITLGRGLMGPYGAIVDVPDRWAIVAYVRALQRARLGTLEDVPEQVRSTLK